MCGIAGYLDKVIVKNLNDNFILTLMKTRGPDHSGLYRDLNNKFCVTLYHSRLTIIDDNKRSHQPFRFKNLILTYNGEIYNFKTIRDELKECGYNFYTEGDTEVVINAYDKWKEKCFEKFDGMWAICIYDIKKRNLFYQETFLEKNLFFITNNLIN